MKTLYVSDLDGTLLNANSRISQYSLDVIDGLVEQGMLFTYATARSIVSASVVAEGLSAKIPVITYNGQRIVYPATGEILDSVEFTREKLMPAYEIFQKDERFTCTFSKELWNCDRVVSFGDAMNDIPMFRISDECYAVSNAADELKALATGIIGANEENGVAQWLKEHAEI